MTPATMTKPEPARVGRAALTKIAVQFVFAPGLKRDVFQNVRLTGSWDGEGRYSDDWSTAPMEKYISEDGCPSYRAQIGLDERSVRIAGLDRSRGTHPPRWLVWSRP